MPFIDDAQAQEVAIRCPGCKRTSDHAITDDAPLCLYCRRPLANVLAAVST